MSHSTDASKDAALRAVGRTIVNFQRLEHNLKLAAQLGPVQGTLQKIQKDIARRQERAGSLTLGQAIQAWLTTCEGTESPSVWTPDLFDVSIRMTFSLESDAESRAAHAKALRYLLDTRNDLIHTRLATFQWESPEACDTLAMELNAVNTSITDQIEYFANLLNDIAAVHKEHAVSVMAELKGAPARSTTGELDA